MVLLVQISMCILPESLVRGTQGGWGPRTAGHRGDGWINADRATCCSYSPVCFWIVRKCPVLFVEAVVVGKKLRRKENSSLLQWCPEQGQGEWSPPPSLAGAEHRGGSCGSRNTAQVAKKCDILKSWGTFLGMSKPGISIDTIFLKFSFSSLNRSVWIFVQISAKK